MTNEEAIEIMKTHLQHNEQYDNPKYFSAGAYYSHKKSHEAISMSIKALEHETPVEPIMGNEVLGLNDVCYSVPTCPACGEVTYSQPRCPFCGQLFRQEDNQ